MTATAHALELVHAAAQAASDKLAEDIIAFDVSDQLRHHRRLRALLGQQRPAGQGDRRRHRGQAARARCQAGTARGRARRPLGPHRLRGDRRARPARGGALLLRPRAAVARLLRPSSCPRRPPRDAGSDRASAGAAAAGRPRGTRPAARRATPTSRSTPPATPRRPRRRRTSPPCGRWRCGPTSPAPGRPAATSPRRLAVGQARRAAPRVRRGARQGLTLDEFAVRFPDEAQWVAGDEPMPVAGGRRRTTCARMVPVLRECLDFDAGETGVVVGHGAALKVGLLGLLGWDIDGRERGARQLRLGHGRAARG